MHGSCDHAVVDMAITTETVLATYREDPESSKLIRQIESPIVRSSTRSLYAQSSLQRVQRAKPAVEKLSEAVPLTEASSALDVTDESVAETGDAETRVDSALAMAVRDGAELTASEVEADGMATVTFLTI
jgi:hypothetical protein